MGGFFKHIRFGVPAITILRGVEWIWWCACNCDFEGVLNGSGGVSAIVDFAADFLALERAAMWVYLRSAGPTFRRFVPKPCGRLGTMTEFSPVNR